MESKSKRRKLNYNPDNIRIKKILEVLKKEAKISDDNFDSSQQPFFITNPTNNFTINYNHIDLDKIPDGLNRNIKNIYQILGDTKKEIYIHNWTILSLDKALENYNLYCSHNQSKIFDIAYTYMGMGHVKVLSCDLDTHLLFFRPDGGSNGYDRDDNFNNLIKNGSSNYKQFMFSDWFFKLPLLENEVLF